jgi:tetratricopeptide (TPR) repeat protein
MKWNRIKNLFTLSFWQFSIPFIWSLWCTHRRKYQKAIAILDRLIIACPKAFHLHLVYAELGINYAHCKDFQKAEQYLLKTLEYGPQARDGQVCMWLGYVYFELGNYSQSIKFLKEAQALGCKGRDKLVVNQEYIQNMLSKADEHLRKQFDPFFCD